MMTADEKTVLRKSLENLDVCDVCENVIYNDGHTIDDGAEEFIVCDGCYDILVQEVKIWQNS